MDDDEKVPVEQWPVLDQAGRLQKAISLLEGWAFGRALRFAGFADHLSIDANGGWTEINGLRGIPRLREFAESLNEATRPIRDEYCHLLRQELANELAKLTTKALSR